MPDVIFSTKPEKFVGDRCLFYLSVFYLRERYGIFDTVGKALCRGGEFPILTPRVWVPLGYLPM